MLSLLMFLGCVAVSWLGTWLVALGVKSAGQKQNEEPRDVRWLW